ncbi:glycerol-3-phosphate dehydrogenase/oxidase [Deinococcus cellulosilyticus]|uniref:FAD-dependent glycerol-3-phosphate dehydrogenase n=1 Tax=Deinococcus cellulosilyticus (strain DSM 18568 / NBRC 106333 / KACC 11606 / 5516J-15) TaxID=1223518 RepID=A0A511N1R1_DEIC1|nr:glycerol-3-phosphate dehydrogenase/oxidase [Deinococcus cellulosilyticus]GEM46381.1 FAD-dependent glycerol-3-phosphate dehydrogenase [Deinococcus cellulosilyticus NBRC 106333 = KACC 11606]
MQSTFDLIVIGGGITGAGLFKEATSRGMRVLLLEKEDYAWGTSGRSSKMVHGGLRYLQHGHLKLTRDSVQERERLLQEAPGLIERIGFLMAVYQEKSVNRLLYGAGLGIYDLMAGNWQHTYHHAEDFQLLAPHLRREGLMGGYQYFDAQTDDARLVLRLIQEGSQAGGTAFNRAPVTGLITRQGQVSGVTYHHAGKEHTAHGLVVNATGVQCDHFREALQEKPRLRPLRGSHLVIPHHRLPTLQALAFQHPADGRNVFVHPWHGHVLIGTTDVDHAAPLHLEPHISPEEQQYLLEGARYAFPGVNLQAADITATWAGVRPVVSSGQKDPSKEAREHLITIEKGLTTVTGGKLTTFRLTAQEALCTMGETFKTDFGTPTTRIFDPCAPMANALVSASTLKRLQGYYGAKTEQVLSGNLTPLHGTQYLQAEVQHAATEQVQHLSDLMLRRLRLGFYLPEGGKPLLPGVRDLAQPVLGWSDSRWEQEENAYLELWASHYQKHHETPALH